MELNVISSARLAAQGVHPIQLGSPVEVVTWLVGIQAQDYAGAKWSIGLRLPETNDNEVEDVLAAQDIVRTWAMRGTLHFVAASDVQWLMALLGPGIIAGNSRRYRQLKLNEATLQHSDEVLAGALQGNQPMDRKELQNILRERGLASEGQQLFYRLQHASLAGLIGQATAPKNRPLFVALAPTPKKSEPSREGALARLATRYFTSHGPATLQDFAWWSGLKAAEARLGLEVAADELEHDTWLGTTYWMASAGRRVDDSAETIELWSAFDPLLVSYRDRAAAIAKEHAAAWSKSKAMFSPSIGRGGRVIGLWKRKIRSDGILISPELFVTLSPTEEKGLIRAAQAYGDFFGLPARLES